MIRARGVCFSTSDRAIVLSYEGSDDMTINKKHSSRGTADMNAYVPEPEEHDKSILKRPIPKALQEIRRQMQVIANEAAAMELVAADEERFTRLNTQNAELVQQNADLFKRISDISTWLDMIKQALASHDLGELSPRQFANEVDAAIKGWESA